MAEKEAEEDLKNSNLLPIGNYQPDYHTEVQAYHRKQMEEKKQSAKKLRDSDLAFDADCHTKFLQQLEKDKITGERDQETKKKNLAELREREISEKRKRVADHVERQKNSDIQYMENLVRHAEQVFVTNLNSCPFYQDI